MKRAIRFAIAVLLLASAVAGSGCAMGAGLAASGISNVVVGDTLTGGKADSSDPCLSSGTCQKLPEGMTRQEYEQRLREQAQRDAAK